MNKPDAGRVRELLEEQCGDTTVRSYSGRAMYGKSCLAITGSLLACIKAVLMVVASVEEASERDAIALWLAGNLRTDSMGFDVVWYWPKLEFLETVEDR